MRGISAFGVHCHNTLKGMRLCTILIESWTLLFHSLLGGFFLVEDCFCGSARAVTKRSMWQDLKARWALNSYEY